MTTKTTGTGAVKMTAELKARLEQFDASYQEIAREFQSLENDPESVFIGLQLEALHEVQSAMEREGVTRAELARRLGCSRQNITQLFSDEANFKLDMVARIAAALGRDVSIRLIEKHEKVVVHPAKAMAPVIEMVALRPNKAVAGKPTVFEGLKGTPTPASNDSIMMD